MKKITAIFVALALLMPTLAGCGSASANKADVVVIGAGGAGLSAAVQAHEAGAKKIVILEKMPMIGGNSLRATGGLNACGTDVQKAKNINDSVDLYVKDTMEGGHNINNPELVKTLAENSADAVKWLTSLGADLSDVGRGGGASVPRLHRPKGGAPVGPMIVDVLKKEVEKDNIEVRLNNKATEILKDKDGKVTGVEAVDKEGKEYTLDAKAVVLATGGFGANKEMVVKYQPGLKGFATTNQPGATGDGIVMAEKLGADFVDMKQIQTHPTVVPEKGILITEALRGNGAIMVNHEGKRFINELGTRDVLSKAILNQNGKTAYLIFNDGVRKSLKACEDYFTQGLVKEGATIEELAKNINVDPATLKATLDTYNGYVTDKKDKEFNKPVEVSLSNGKYYAIEITPAIHHTMGGVKINPKAEVIGKDGQPIKGLFAAGEVTGGVHGGNRLGGNAVADIVVFGRIAGNSAAEFIKSK